MKKILILFTIIFSVCLTFTIQTQADEVLIYPFDSIKITSAYKFDVLIEQDPVETSILYGQVALNETVTIYVGSLEFMLDGLPASGSGSMMIVTNAAGVDIAAWLVNSFSTDLTTYETYDFASWITIDPTVGVIKDFTGLTIEMTCYHDLVNDTYKFIDNTAVEYPMIAGTFVSETGLDILVSAYVEEVTE